MIDPHLTDLVIFDCDGVLVDSEPLANTVMADHITRLGWPMTGQETIGRFKGRTMAQVHTLIEDQLGRAIDPVWRDAFHAETLQRMKDDLTAVPGIVPLIDRVHAAGLNSCVASQGRHEKMAVSLGTTGLLDIFRGRIFSAVDVARPKPHPDLFLHAARQMETAPNRCLVIEDSPTGLAGAIAAGMSVIGLDRDETGELARDGVYVVASLDAISVGPRRAAQ